jgi:ribosomal protein L3
MAFEVIGKLHRVFPIEQKTATFQAREFVLEIASGQYSEYVKFQAIQDRCQLLDAFQEGDVVKVSFDLRGREWQGKYFTNLNAWRIEKADSNATAASAAEQHAADPFPDYTAAPPPTNAVDDLPF